MKRNENDNEEMEGIYEINVMKMKMK